MKRSTRHEVMAAFWFAAGLFCGWVGHDNPSMVGCFVLSMLSSDRAERAK